MHELIAALPKCEQHMHLEGSLEPELLFQLAEENGIALPPPAEDDAFASAEALLKRYRRFTSLSDFLHYYFIGMTVLIKESDFEALAWAYFERAHREGVVHAEVFFDPQAHTDRGVAYSTVVSGFQAACRRAEAAFGMSTELIVCILRHLPFSSAEEMYQSALADLKSGAVAGLGLSSTEMGNPPKNFSSIFLHAASQGIRRTAHAGEEADVSYMRDALDSLQVHRIDHGIKLREDPDLMATFASQKILITMCPLSNVELRCVSKIEDLPIREYLDNNVPFSINSDDPAYFGGYILANYCAVQDAFQLSVGEWATIATNAIVGGWCSEKRKDEMLKRLALVLEGYAER